MATLTVWKFDEATGARQALQLLERQQKAELIEIADAAIVTWPEGRKKPKTRQLHNMAGAGALGGSFWGLLFGLIFFVPILGLAVGAAVGALTASMADVGIDDDFIRNVRDKVTPGTSALFAMTPKGVTDGVLEQFEGSRGELIPPTLSSEKKRKLGDAFKATKKRVCPAHGGYPP